MEVSAISIHKYRLDIVQMSMPRVDVSLGGREYENRKLSHGCDVYNVSAEL